jgi:hypothetical protein
MWVCRRLPHLQSIEPVKRPEQGWAWNCGQAACVAKEKGESQDMQHEIPADALGPATAGSFGCTGAGSSISCEVLATTTSTLLHSKRSVPLFAVERSHGAREVRDVLALFPVTCTVSGPAIPVVCNMVDRHNGREDVGRAARTRGRRGLCRRDHPRAARGSPAHI